MSNPSKKLGFWALVAGMAVTCAAQTAPAPKPKSQTVRTGISRKKSAAKKAPEPPPVVEQPQAPPAPPPPSRPFELSPVPPQVTFQGGQLTISAPNSTLADILGQVRVRIGTKVDFPPSAAQERVALQLGPGTPRDVLSQLLHGSPFDYILLGSEQDPNAVTQIVLTRREAGAAPTTTAGNRPNPAPPQAEPEEESENETAAQPAPPQPLAQPTPGQVVPGQPAQQPFAGPAAMQQAPEQNAPGTQTTSQPSPQNTATTPGQTPGQNEVKTPEQLLQQLQQMQREEQLKRQRPPR